MWLLVRRIVDSAENAENGNRIARRLSTRCIQSSIVLAFVILAPVVMERTGGVGQRHRRRFSAALMARSCGN